MVDIKQNESAVPEQNQPSSLAQALATILTAQRDLYVQLSALARKQSECVATAEAESLMAVLAARSRLIDQISPLDRQLQPYKGQWQSVLDSLNSDDRSTVAGLLKQVQQLLAEILEQDEADKQSLMRQKTDVGAQLGKVVTGSQLNRAYGVQPRPTGRSLG